MEGERKFDIDLDLPENIADEFYQLFDEDVFEEKSAIKRYFKELLALKRAVFLVELCAPIDVVHKAEYLLREHGYKVYSHIEFGLDLREGLKRQTPGKVEALTSMYISLRDEFLELVKLSDAIIDGDVLCELLFGYSVKNIIGYLDQADPSHEELEE